MTRILLMSAVCVAVFSAGCSAQSPDRPSDGKPEGDGAKKDGAKVKSLDDLTRVIAGEADTALKANADDLGALWKKASAEFHLKDYKSSRTAVDAGLKKNGDDPRFHFQSAALYGVTGETKKFQEEVDWLLKRDQSYATALGFIQTLEKKETREKFQDAHQAAWLIAEGHATPETKASLVRDLDIGATTAIMTACSPWHTDEQYNRLQATIVTIGKPAKPMLEAIFELLRKNGGQLEDDYNAFARRSIKLAGEWGLRSDEPGVQEKLDALLKETKGRGVQHAKEIKEIGRQMSWMKETYQKIKD